MGNAQSNSTNKQRKDPQTKHGENSNEAPRQTTNLPNLQSLQPPTNNRYEVNYESSAYVNEEFAKIKQSLKFLYKNNFVSLTFEDLSAYCIQMHWKQYAIQKIRNKNKGMIEVIYSSMGGSPNITSKQDRLFVNLDSKRYPYKCYDLMSYKGLKKVVEKFGGFESLPAVFINNYYIGSAGHFQELEDLRLTNSIVTKEYQKRCLMCNIIKSDKELDTCPHCYKSYLFFIKADLMVSVHANRFLDKDEEILYIN